MAASTIRAMKGVAAIVSGTIAACVPIDVPAIKRVNGTIATTRMIKGVERVTLTRKPRMACAAGAANNSPLLLVAKNTPSGRPNTTPNPPASATMVSVSIVASMMMRMSSGDIAHLLFAFQCIAKRVPFSFNPEMVDIADNMNMQIELAQS